MVVIVDSDEVAELQVTSHTGGLACDTFHCTSVAEEAVGVVAEELKVGLVECSSDVLLCNRKTNGIGETLTEGSGGHLNTGAVVRFRVTCADAIDLL